LPINKQQDPRKKNVPPESREVSPQLKIPQNAANQPIAGSIWVKDCFDKASRRLHDFPLLVFLSLLEDYAFGKFLSRALFRMSVLVYHL
jgi:hypothetical protein